MRTRRTLASALSDVEGSDSSAQRPDANDQSDGELRSARGLRSGRMGSMQPHGMCMALSWCLYYRLYVHLGPVALDVEVALERSRSLGVRTCMHVCM